MYGAAFGAKWEGIDAGQIKATWAKQLARYHRAEIVRASDMLPAGDFPPSLPKFLEICQAVRDMSRSLDSALKLTEKIDPNDPEIVAARELFFENARKMGATWAIKLGRA